MYTNPLNAVCVDTKEAIYAYVCVNSLTLHVYN